MDFAPDNLTFRPTKTRRFVSVAANQPDHKKLIDLVKPFDDLFDQVILSSFPPVAGAPKSRYAPDAHKYMVDELHAMQISVLNCHGWRFTEQCREACSSRSGIQQCIDYMVGLCLESGADGLDVDFEAWPAETRYVYLDFVGLLSEALHARGKTLTASIFPVTPAARRERGIGFIDPHALAPLVDQFHVMTYDMFAPPSLYIGPTSTAPWVRDSMRALAQMAPAHKLMLGLPTYSIDWNLNDPTKSRCVSDAAYLAEKEQLSPIGRGWCYYWDVGLIRYEDDAGHAHLLYVSDARSTRSHLATADEFDLAGVFFWVLGGSEDTNIYHAVRNHFQR